MTANISVYGSWRTSGGDDSVLTTLTGDASGYTDGVILAVATIIATALLEVLSYRSVGRILQQPDGKRLYALALLVNFFNHLVLGPPVYCIAITLFCTPRPHTPLWSAVTCVGCLLTHAVCYYTAHRAMHTRSFYWAHRFHHRFNKHVSPVIANAVTLVEYLVAYILPFVVGALLFRPDGRALFTTVTVVSGTNLLIHTPGLEALSQDVVPWFGVSTFDHLEHHRRLTKNYAAPTLNVDRVLRLSETLEKSVSACFGLGHDAPEKVQ